MTPREHHRRRRVRRWVRAEGWFWVGMVAVWALAALLAVLAVRWWLG